MRSFSSFAMVTAVVTLGCTGPALGAQTATLPVSSIEREAPPPAPATTLLGTPVSGESLQSLRGGDSSTTNDVDIRGGVDGNTANNVVSGTNIIQDGSFANSSGISTVIQNSGSNVLIQNGTVVNVQFVDPGL